MIKTISIYLYALLFFTASHAAAQKIQIKDDVILKDRNPIAKLEGKAKLGQTLNLRIVSNSGQPLIVLSGKVAKYGSSFYKDTHYTSVELPSLNKTFSRVEMHDWAWEKKIVSFLFDQIGEDFLSDQGLNPERMTSYLATGDQSESIKSDTLTISELVKGFHRELSRPITNRDRTKKIEFGVCTDKQTKWKKYLEISDGYYNRTFSKIFQGYTEIGLLVKCLNGDSQFGMYFILRKVGPFKIGDYEDEYVPLAFLHSYHGFAVDKKFFIENAAPNILAPVFADAANAETDLITYLVNHGYL